MPNYRANCGCGYDRDAFHPENLKSGRKFKIHMVPLDVETLIASAQNPSDAARQVICAPATIV
jgi:hypothetical protein